MVRFTLALKGQSKSPDTAIEVKEQLVDIYKSEQLEERFLIEVNPKGQVPAMTSQSLPSPLTDSVDITYYLCEHYPSLSPQAHRDTIKRLISELHDIQYLSLSFTPQQNRAKGITDAVEKLLERTDISDEYRKALKFKAQYHEVTLVHALEPEPIARAEKQATDFFQQIRTLRSQHAKGSLWIFGDEVGPTALDAHAVTFVARLFDAHRQDLVGDDMGEYGKKAMSTKEWESVMQGRPTLYHLWKKMPKT